MWAERPSSCLQSGAQHVLQGTLRGEAVASAPATHRGGSAGREAQDMTVEEMERALAMRRSRRLPESVRDGPAPQTARALLEENKALIQEKQERKALERKNSREFVEKLLAQDRMTTEGDKAKEVGRRHAQRELAQYYKAKIAEKEKTKANAYTAKVEGISGIQYFPFVEGENIDKSREAKTAMEREEMRRFLRRQRERNPPRVDVLQAETSMENAIHYPLGSCKESEGVCLPGYEVAPHMSRHPRFLSRAREHLSRRLHDAHIRKALEDKVVQTKAELDAFSQGQQAEALLQDEGLQVTDAMRQDLGQARAMERRVHQQFLKSQIEERKGQTQKEVQERRAHTVGYYGPEEKELQDRDLHKQHCSQLIKQMEVDHLRRAGSRNQRLRQERRLIDNSMAEMSQDRAQERQKRVQHREVLTTTWKSQQQIRDTMRVLDRM